MTKLASYVTLHHQNRKKLFTILDTLEKHGAAYFRNSNPCSGSFYG